MKSIMLATDFSERSDRALRRATLLADQFGATLTIIHVVDDDQPRTIVDRERELATSFLRELKETVTDVDGIACKASVVLGAPFAGIAQAVEHGTPDLLVIGPHRRQALRDVFIGTTAERTIHSVDCPVLMVNAPPVGPYRRSLLTTDLSEGARRTAQCFHALGIGVRTDVTLLHVFETPALSLVMNPKTGADEKASYIADERKVAAQKLSAFAAATGEIVADRILRHAEAAPAQEILSAARAQRSDLIVVGTHSRSGLLRFFLGSVAEEVLRSADRDVLAVPPNSPVPQTIDTNTESPE